MVTLSEWKAQVRASLSDLEMTFEQDMGYPMGANYVDDADQDMSPEARRIADIPVLGGLYKEIAEASLSDVHICYFIHPVRFLLEASARDLPARAESPTLTADLLPIGSDGGGDLFCVAVNDGSVWLLPLGGIEDGVYSGGLEDPRLVASDIFEFLERLLAVIREFAVTGCTLGI